MPTRPTPTKWLVEGAFALARGKLSTAPYVARASSSFVALSVVSLLALSLGSCTEKALYWTPEGGDASIAGRWTLHGVAPSRDACEAAGIAEVQLVFVHLGVESDFGTFTFPCAQGAFDSRPVAALAAGTYDVRWGFSAADGGGSTYETAVTTITAVAGGHVAVPPGDFEPPPPDGG